VSLFPALLIAAAIVWATSTISRAIQSLRAEFLKHRQMQLLALLSPARGRAQDDPAALLEWRRLSDVARVIVPEEAAALDRAAGERYPFTAADVQDAHARWSAAWLAWERANDSEFKARSAALHADATRGGDGVPRAKLEALEQEKLDVYQRKYAEYVRVSKALQALL
jgi:hypothetical protein